MTPNQPGEEPKNLLDLAEAPSVSSVGPLVLVADDDAATRDLVSDVLAHAGFRTVTAADGEKLVELAAAHQPALILLDVNMPNMDGYTTLTHLRGHPSTREIPVIIVTGEDEPVYQNLSGGLGAAAHVTKPFSPHSLTETVLRVLADRRTHLSEERRLGEILVERGVISAEQLREALHLRTQEQKQLGQTLVEMGALTSDEMNWARSELFGVPYVDLTEEMVDLNLARTLPEEALRRHQAVPLVRVGNEITVALPDPTNRQAVMELEALSGATVRIAMAARETVAQLLDRAFPPSAAARDGVRYAEVRAIEAPTEADPTGVAQAYALLIGAFREQATEIHVEPLPEEIRVRYRIDGRLVERARLPRSALVPTLVRFRVLAGLRGESLPTATQVRTRLDGREVELDLLFYRSLYGESVTVSIWQGLETPTLESLELEPSVRDVISRLLAVEGGLVLVTGSESRARAALLYAMARAVSAPAKKTLTLERAVSFVMPEFVQVEVPGDFGAAAATILTQPTDIALVEDVASAPACLAAFSSAQRGTLVLGGLGFATNAIGLSHVVALDVPRNALLATIRGLVHVRRRGLRYWVDEVLPMTDELRRGLTSR